MLGRQFESLLNFAVFLIFVLIIAPYLQMINKIFLRLFDLPAQYFNQKNFSKDMVMDVVWMAEFQSLMIETVTSKAIPL